MSLYFTSPTQKISLDTKAVDQKTVPLTALRNFLEKMISKKDPKKSSNEISTKVANIFLKLKINKNIQKEVEIDSLLEAAKQNLSNKEDGYIYENILNLFATSNTKMLEILKKCHEKLEQYNETALANDIEWVMMIINNEAMYNYSFELGHLTDEDEIQLIKTYTIDPLSLSKEADIKIAKNISSKRETYSKRKSIAGPIIVEKNGNVINYVKLNAAASQNAPAPKFERKGKKSSTVKQKEKINVHVPIDFDQPSRNSYGYNPLFSSPSRASTNVEKEKPKENPHDFILKKKSRFGEALNNKEESHSTLVFTETPPISPSKKFIDNDQGEAEEGPIIVPMSSSHEPLFNDEDDSKKPDSNDQYTISQFDVNTFNIFEYLTTSGRENVLYTVSTSILDKYGFFSFINETRYRTFIDKIRLGYDYLIPYHNDLHATDVMQTTHLIINGSKVKNDLDLTSLDLCGLFLACIVHDYKHPGLNNSYLINSHNPIAIRYNDISVLEQYHISSAFKTISKPNSDIFCDLSREEHRIIRKRMVECVLATDMAKHTSSLKALKARYESMKKLMDSTGNSFFELLVNYVPEDTKFDRQQEILNFIIHSSDISNTGKPFELCKKWTDLLMEEFFAQGDKEIKENLPVSFLCDREKTDIEKSQINFIINITLPCFQFLSTLIPTTCQHFVKNLEDNLEKWKELSDEKAKKYANFLYH